MAPKYGDGQRRGVAAHLASPSSHLSWRSLLGFTILLGFAAASENNAWDLGDTDQFVKSTVRVKRADPSRATLRIVTLEHPPYVLIDQKADGSKSYTGFLPDMIYQLSRMVPFEYEFYESPDGRWGAPQADGRWNGMIGELMKRQYINGSLSGDPNEGADLCASALTMTAERENVVDFVVPYHHLGFIPVVRKKYLNQNETDSWPFDFNIFKPLAAEVWGMAVMAVIVVGLMLWGINHFNPYEWGGRYGLGLATEHQKNSFSLAGSMWFVFSTFQWQGFERAPRSIASKVLTCFWFFFVTVTLATYTGGLVNHLFWASMVHGVNPTRSPIIDLKDLVLGQGKDFKYGVVRGGSIYQYVTQVAALKWPEFNQMKSYWESEAGQQQLVNSTDEGLRRVREEKYAFIMESMSAKYHLNQAPCDLATVGEQFGVRSYGLALPRDSPYLAQFHLSLLQLMEEGEVDALEEQWWTGRGECWNVTVMERHLERLSQLFVNKPKQVNLSMFWGVLVLLVVGVIISLITAVVEILYYKYKGREKMAESLTVHGGKQAAGSDFET